MAAYRKSRLLLVCRLERHACTMPLPLRCRTVGISHILSDWFSHRLLQDRLATAKLRHHGEQLLTIISHATISNVIAIPTRRGIESVELGQGDLGDASSCAIDQH